MRAVRGWAHGGLLLIASLPACEYEPAARCQDLTSADVTALGDPGLSIPGPQQITRGDQILALRAGAAHPDRLPSLDPEAHEAWTLARADAPIPCPTRAIRQASCAQGAADITLDVAPEGCDEAEGVPWVAIHHRPFAIQEVHIQVTPSP